MLIKVGEDCIKLLNITLGLGNGAGIGVGFDVEGFFSTLGEEIVPRIALPPPAAAKDFFLRFCFSSSSSISFSQSTWKRDERGGGGYIEESIEGWRV